MSSRTILSHPLSVGNKGRSSNTRSRPSYRLERNSCRLSARGQTALSQTRSPAGLLPFRCHSRQERMDHVGRVDDYRGISELHLHRHRSVTSVDSMTSICVAPRTQDRLHTALGLSKRMPMLLCRGNGVGYRGTHCRQTLFHGADNVLFPSFQLVSRCAAGRVTWS